MLLLTKSDTDTAQALADKQKALADLQRVANEPAMTQSDLEALKGQIRELSAENNKLIEKRMSSNAGDDKLTVLRQQVWRCPCCVVSHVARLQSSLERKSQQLSACTKRNPRHVMNL